MCNSRENLPNDGASLRPAAGAGVHSPCLRRHFPKHPLYTPSSKFEHEPGAYTTPARKKRQGGYPVSRVLNLYVYVEVVRLRFLKIAPRRHRRPPIPPCLTAHGSDRRSFFMGVIALTVYVYGCARYPGATPSLLRTEHTQLSPCGCSHINTSPAAIIAENLYHVY